MKYEHKKYLQLDLIFTLIAVTVCIAVLYPILSQVRNYPYTVLNCFYIVLFIFNIRFIFYLKHSFFANRSGLLTLFAILLFFVEAFCLFKLQEFIPYAEYEAESSIRFKNIFFESEQLRNWLVTYITNEMYFFVSACVSSSLMLQGVLLYRVWKNWQNNENLSLSDYRQSDELTNKIK